MTHDQFNQWKDFALRMAQTCFKDSIRPPADWILQEVGYWFARIEDDPERWAAINSWDQDEWPLCDQFIEATYYYGPDNMPSYDELDDLYGEALDTAIERLEHRRDMAEEQYNDQWLGPIRFCLRAGIDTVCPEHTMGIGVIGLTAGDLRRMYPEGVPDWVSGGERRWFKGLTDELNGTFAEMPDKQCIFL